MLPLMGRVLTDEFVLESYTRESLEPFWSAAYLEFDPWSHMPCQNMPDVWDMLSKY